MLDLMRKHARNWIMKVLLGIIIVVFIFYFGSMGRGRHTEVVATVDGKTIGYADLQKEYQTLVQFYRQRLGGMMTDEMLKGLNLKQQALENLVQQAMILQKAKELNLAVTDQDVQNAIMATPAFRRGGVFDERIYNQVLRVNKLTPEEFALMQSHAGLGKKIFERISDDEWGVFRGHTDIGAKIFGDARSPLLIMAARIAITHHERWDGRGYPLALAGEAIPLEGRITAVADVFDALASKRPYKPAFPLAHCLALLEQGRGTQFDPAVVDGFLARRDEVVEIQIEYADYD